MTEPSARVLDDLQRRSFAYFLHEHNADNGLVLDKSSPDAPASIAAVGFALACYPVAVERGFMRRDEALKRTLRSTRFFLHGPSDGSVDGLMHRGFFYHFLDMKSGQRVWQSELSTIDTGLLLLGLLLAAQYFSGDGAVEREIRDNVDAICRRVDWKWSLRRNDLITLGWKPETGFLRTHWRGYSEGLILYVLGLGAPESPLPESCYAAWTSSYQWRNVFGHELLYAGPLFIHQYPHAWIDFREIQDAYMRSKAIDYFENSRRVCYVQREYAIRNPKQFKGYNEDCWGITASDGPGPCVRTIDGKRRRFYGYSARGVPFDRDDGTLSPWATVSSLPFAPEIVIPAMESLRNLEIGKTPDYGFEASFNPTFPSDGRHPAGWVSEYHFAINQGPLVLMLENFRSGLIWRLMRECRWIKQGLLRAGFTGGWLGDHHAGAETPA